MDHQQIKELIVRMFDEDINENIIKEIKEHIKSCSECKKEFEFQQNLDLFFNKDKKFEPSEKLLNEARLELRGVLKTATAQVSTIQNFKDKLDKLIKPSYQLALGGVFFLLIGFLIGYDVFHNNEIPVNNSNKNNTTEFQNASLLEQSNVRINNIRFISKNPNTGELEFTFDATKPIHIKGNINDPKIQSILTYSMVNEPNPGVRLNSINAISKDRPSKLDNDVKTALISVVRNDENPGVRRAALLELNKFPYDNKIKNALLYVLKKDKSSAMRIEAINGLVEAQKKGYSFGPEELSVFKEKMAADENNYVRHYAKTFVEENRIHEIK